MSSISDVPAGVASQGLLESRADQLAARLAQSKPADSRLKSSAHQFEAILIGKWLEEAEATFAKLPGDDENPDADPRQDQFRSMALQFLAEGISSAGGLGVASMMILKHLECNLLNEIVAKVRKSRRFPLGSLNLPELLRRRAAGHPGP